MLDNAVVSSRHLQKSTAISSGIASSHSSSLRQSSCCISFGTNNTGETRPRGSYRLAVVASKPRFVSGFSCRFTSYVKKSPSTFHFKPSADSCGRVLSCRSTLCRDFALSSSGTDSITLRLVDINFANSKPPAFNSAFISGTSTIASSTVLTDRIRSSI